MRSWVLLLLLAARLRLGSAEGDPLPSTLVHLLRTSDISSVDDLELLLQESNATEEEEDEHHVLMNQSHSRFTRSLGVEAQPAQQAACKVRTEVLEVTRSMLDRRNANFLLWPPCVEVQRCSGCCNTRLLQCVPTASSTRHLQVIKIQYVNQKARYDKATVSVEDHVSCRCQPPSSSSSSSSVPFQSNPHPLPPPPSSHLPPPLPRTVHPAPPKTHASKADLHRHDVLKHNQQRPRPEARDPVALQWQQGRYTQLVHWTAPRGHQPGAGVLASRPSEAWAEHSIVGGAPQVGHGSGADGSREESGVPAVSNGGGGEVHHPDHMQRQQQLLQHQQRQQQHHRQPLHREGAAEGRELRTQHRLNAPQSDGASPPGGPTQTPKLEEDPAPPATTNRTDSVTGGKTTEVTTQTATVATGQTTGGDDRVDSGSAHSRDSGSAHSVDSGSAHRVDSGSAHSGDSGSAHSGDNGSAHRVDSGSAPSGDSGSAHRVDSGSAPSGDVARAEPANRGAEKDSEVGGGFGHLTEEERRRKALEMVQTEPEHQAHLHPLHPHHPQQRPKPTTFQTALVSPSPRRPPFRPASPRRRRKHRKRISKAAIRAMIM